MNSLIRFGEKFIRDTSSSNEDAFAIRRFALEASREGYADSDSKDRALIPLAYIKSSVKLSVRCEGLMYGVSGFAEAMRNICYYLDKDKVNVSAHPLDSEEADNVNVSETKKGQRIKELSKIVYDTDLPKVRIVMTIPEGVNRIADYYMIAYIMFETQDFPKKYIKHLNIHADEIWTPSQFNVDNIKRAGWKKPIYRMPLGVDTKRFDPSKVKPFKSFESKIGYFKDDFVFLSIMGWSERKGVSPLLEAYIQEFSADEKVVLYIKGGWYDENKAIKEVWKVWNKYAKKKNPSSVCLDFRIYPEQDSPRLYKSANAFVLPTLGEGWGLNFTEAMSMNLPTIGTKSTSQIDFMTDDNSWLVKVKGYKTEPRCDWICADYKKAKFSIPDVKDLRRQMRDVYNSKIITNFIRNTMVNNWTWEHAAKNWINRLKDLSVQL